ncbi:hypothetical protein ACTWP5_09860 [Streptomyces sp. 4N509B]|uniref:hypothetical protein n=1 Tax=Streptomyces sp. 4N509B TaxID=3457413 RepID=UPI003FD043CD
MPVHVRRRSWADAWTRADCPSCGRSGQWPLPEFGCPCGATVRLTPAAGAGDGDGAGRAGGADAPAPPEGTPRRRTERPPFRPLTIRTAHDATACAARYVRWLGFEEVHALSWPAPSRFPQSGSVLALRGPGVVGMVNASTTATGERAVETLWLHGLHAAARAVAFSLAGYERPARDRAGALGLPLFVFDLTGAPQPVNDPADALLRHGPGGGDLSPPG